MDISFTFFCVMNEGIIISGQCDYFMGELVQADFRFRADIADFPASFFKGSDIGCNYVMDGNEVSCL